MPDSLAKGDRTTADERLALVVPCYDEARRLDLEAFATALRTMTWLHLVFVDDGSRDATGTVLAGFASGWVGRVAVVSLQENRGKAEAVRQGLQAARAHAPLCGFWDADLAAPLSELPALRERLLSRDDIEWVWGIRLRALGRDIVRRAPRHYLGRLFATVTSTVLGIDAYDTQCGAKLFRSAPLLDLVLAEPFVSRWIFDVEMLARANQLLGANGARSIHNVIYEQPLARWHHKPGSKVRTGDFIRALIELQDVHRSRRRWFRPEPLLAVSPAG